MQRFLALAICGCTFTTRAALFPVLDGSKQATVVYEDDARDEAVSAYKDLALYLGKATGKDFAPVAEKDFKPGPGTYPIYVGICRALPADDRRELDKADRDAFLVRVTPEAVHLAGPRPWSTYWAVCQFLEDHAGVRWLIPGPLGEDVPKQPLIVAGTYRQLHTPAIRSRLWSGAHYGGVWSLRQRIHGRYRFHHNLLNVFNSDKLYDAHPEWFPQRGGERYRPSGSTDHSWQPCLASESSVKHAADTAREAWAKDADLESYSYGCNDGQGWCECAGCMAMDQPIEPWDGFEGTYSYRFYGWLNKVAAEAEKTDPDKLLGCLAYSTYILPPEKLGLHRNVIPYFTSNRADYFDRGFRKKDQALLEWWGRVANQMGIYDYAYGMGFVIPRIYNHLFQGAIQHAVEHGVRGFYAEVYPNWGLDGHKLYVMSRVLWNPEIDIDAVTDDWNKRMFREAAAPMAKHFELCERTWRKQNTGGGHWAYRLAADPKQFEIFSPRVLATCTRYLDQAAELARDETVSKRIHFFRKTWDVTRVLADNYWAGRDLRKQVERGASLEKIAGGLRRLAEQAEATDMDAYIKEKVGDDPIAFHPPKPSWISPLKGGGTATAMRWAAYNVARTIVSDARKSGKISAGTVRGEVQGRMAEAFGTEGSEVYLTYVGQIREMAKKVATAAKATTPPKVDGMLDEPVWTQADTIKDFIQHGQIAASRYTTVAKILHDGANLYIALECLQDTSKLQVLAAPRDGATWKDDSIEIFINPGIDEFPHVQFIINAKGAFFDQWARKEGQTYAERLSVDFDCDWGAKVRSDGWTAEVRVPLSEFRCTPKQCSSLLRMNVVRNVQGKDAEISAWFSSIRAHADPLSRGWVVLE